MVQFSELSGLKPSINCSCCYQLCEEAIKYQEKPEGETLFNLKNGKYERSYYKCGKCNHYFSDAKIDLKTFYQSDYTSRTYKDKVETSFKRIINLPDHLSDNTGRVKYLKEYVDNSCKKGLALKLLDVGSGLGVFPYAINNLGWKVTASDPNIQSVEHIRNLIGIECIHGDFMSLKLNNKYDIITFNKVLEHIYNPAELLVRAFGCLRHQGFVYIEVPDGETASKESLYREEFFYEHLHVFSEKSLKILVENVQGKIMTMNRLIEPSGKYTIRAVIGQAN